MRGLLFSVLLLVVLTPVHSQRTDQKLERKVRTLLEDFHGNAGVYIKDLHRNKIVAINADTVFPTASMIKVPILIGMMSKISGGEFQYHQELEYKDSLFYSDGDILGSFKAGSKISLAKLIMLMLTTSDNTASLWLQGLAGGGARINAIMDSLGLYQTKVNSRTPGRDSIRLMYGWGQTTPKEMVMLFEKMYRYELFSREISTLMMRVLGRNYWDEQSLSEIPPTIEVFSKNGAVNASRSEILLVNAPHHPYVFCIITKNNKDQSWGNTNEAWVLSRNLSKLLWEYFEPHYKR